MACRYSLVVVGAVLLQSGDGGSSSSSGLGVMGVVVLKVDVDVVEVR